MFFSSSQKPGWLAILSQESGITLAHAVRHPGGRPEIVGLGTLAIESGSGSEKGGGMRAALAALKSTHRLKSYRCTTLMGENEYQITQLEAPSVPVQERREALRWSLRELVNYPVETACLGVLDIPGEGSSGNRAAGVLVVSADEQAVRARVAPFEEAHVPLTAIDVPDLAQRNVAALLEDKNRGLVFVRLDENGSLLTLTYRGELMAVRRSEITTRQMLADKPEQRAQARERLVLNIQRSLDNFDRQYSHISVSRVILSMYPRIGNLATELAENVDAQMQVLEMDLASVIDFPNVPELRNPGFQARHLLAIGAALRTGEDGA